MAPGALLGPWNLTCGRETPRAAAAWLQSLCKTGRLGLGAAQLLRPALERQVLESLLKTQVPILCSLRGEPPTLPTPERPPGRDPVLLWAVLPKAAGLPSFPPPAPEHEGARTAPRYGIAASGLSLRNLPYFFLLLVFAPGGGMGAVPLPAHCRGSHSPIRWRKEKSAQGLDGGLSPM